jgi:hypothetical protein
MVVARQAVLDLQLGARLLQPQVIIIWLDVPKRDRVDLVDRDVQVPVIGVLMDGTDALVLLESNRPADLVFDIYHLVVRRPLTFRERDDKMI